MNQSFWILKLWSSMLLGAIVISSCNLNFDDPSFYILPILIASTCIGAPTAVIKGAGFSDAFYFVIVASLLWFVSIMLGLIAALTHLKMFSVNLLATAGAVSSWWVCYAFDRVFFNKFSARYCLVYFIVGYVVVWLSSISTLSDLNASRIFCFWYFGIGICVTLSIIRNMKALKTAP